MKIFCELYSRLTAEGNNHSHRLLSLYNIHDIFLAKRLKIQPVSRVVVGRDSFRIVIDYNNIVALLSQGPYAVHR